MLLTFDLLVMIMRARGLLKAHMTWDIMANFSFFVATCWTENKFMVSYCIMEACWPDVTRII